MQTLRVNGYDMAYLEVGKKTDQRQPLVCAHGSLCDFRIWSSVLGPLTKKTSRDHGVLGISSPNAGTASATPIRSRSMSPM